MTNRDAKIIVSDFIYSNYLLNVYGGGATPPTDRDIKLFLEARDTITTDEYRKISSIETERYKFLYDL